MGSNIATLTPGILGTENTQETSEIYESDCRKTGTCVKGLTEFGITVQMPSEENPQDAYDDLERARETGVTWIRLSVRNPELIDGWGNANQGVRINQDVLQMNVEFLEKARSYGMKICLMVIEGYIGDVSYEYYIGQMRDFWNQIAEKLAPLSDVWQVFNEPDGIDYRHYEPVDEFPDQTAYYKELASAIAACGEEAHKYNPDVLITTNLYGYPVNDDMYERWIRNLTIIADSQDIITIDAYPQNNRERTKSLPTVMRDIGNRFNKNVMIGEIGVQTCPDCYSEEDQAQYYEMYIELLDSAYIDTVFLFTLRNREDEHTGEGSFGIYNYDGSKKEAFYTVQQSLAAHKKNVEALQK